MTRLWVYVILNWAVVGRTTLSFKYPEKASLTYQHETYQGVAERAAEHGYSVTEHTVKTEDGYLLTLFRMQRPGRIIGPPIVLMHGLLQTAGSWLDAGPAAGLAYLLPEAGLDLWLGNARGNNYSRRHAWLNPDTDPKFWQFCVDEIGRYDLPAIVDYVLSQTGVDKLNYIGFSQGAGTFLIMCSERPEYCDKVKVMIALAPSTRHLFTKSFVFRTLTQFYNIKEHELIKHGIWEVFPIGGFLNSLVRYFCALSKVTLQICESVKDVSDAPNPGSITPASLKAFTGDFPAGTSVHNMARYGQSTATTKFQKFDYGTGMNLKMYCSKCPPSFNLSAVTVPTVVIYGKNDGIADIRDVKWLIGKLPNVIEAVEVKHPCWSHVDMYLSKYVPQFVYPKIIEYLNKYNKCIDN